MKTKISLILLLLAAWLMVGCEGQNEPTSEGGDATVESTDIASVNKKINFYGTIYEVIMKDGNRMYFGLKNDKEVRMGCWSYFYDGCEDEYDTYAPYEYKGHLVIPEKITLEGKEYMVTELYRMSASSYSLNMGIIRPERPNTTLLSVVIPKTIKEMRSLCFSCCTALKSVTFATDSPIKGFNLRTFLGCSSLEEVILPENLSSIGEEVFWSCTSLKTINLPETVTEIDCKAFLGCISLENINLENVKVIGKEGWESSAFAGCTALKNVNLESAIKIYRHTFSGCTSLENIKLDNLEVLGREAFDSCTSLKKIELPSIKYLGIDVEEDEDERYWQEGDAFVDCRSLETVVLGSSLIKTNRDNALFEGCDNLKDVYCYAVNPPLYPRCETSVRDGEFCDERKFMGDFILHVLATSIEAYKQTSWGYIDESIYFWADQERTIVAIEE